MGFHVVIPARYESTRFPGKPLIDLAGKTMIQRVVEQGQLSNAESVHVATDDERIAKAVEAFGGSAVMTREDHPSGTDRIHEAVSRLGFNIDDVIVNVQGDEPLIPPAAINQVAGAVTDDIRMATLCERIHAAEDVFNPNVVKVVRDQADRALYFSRAPVPWDRDRFESDRQAAVESGLWFRHLGIYAYTPGLLSDFVSWPVASLEACEKLEQLRVMAQGESIAVLESGESIPPGIDTPEDIAPILAALQKENP